MPVTLDEAVHAMLQIAPLHLAEEWDNVGLLLEPSKPKTIRRLLLTIDLTSAVTDEAIGQKAQLVVAYHPPIFQPLKHLAGHDHLTRLIENRIAVYSPHTALDAVSGGVNDFLADAFGRKSVRIPIRAQSGGEMELAPYVKIVVFVPVEAADKLRKELGDAGIGWIGNYSHCSFNAEGTGTFLGHEGTKPAIGKRGKLESVREVRLEMIAEAERTADAEQIIHQHHPYEEPAFDVYPLLTPTGREQLAQGGGRMVMLDRPWKISRVINAVKKHLKLKKIRAAISPEHRNGLGVMNVALCAGAGGSILTQCIEHHEASVLLSGEMRHHDILAANERGISVILCDHTNTERGYLPLLKKKLRESLGKSVAIDIAKTDREPLEIR